MTKKETTIQLKDRSIRVELTRRRGTRRLRLSIGLENQLKVSAPWNCSEKAVWRFIEEHRAWIEQCIEVAPEVMPVSDWLRRYASVSVDGRVFEVLIECLEERRWGHYVFCENVDRVRFQLPKGAGEPAFQDLIRSFAKETLQRRLCFHTQRLGLEVDGFSVRDQTSRWGSCSSKKRISLNWRLVLLEPDLQDYVILHELAHLRELNHSARFWALLDQYDPNREAHEKALHRCSAMLMRVGR